MRHTASRNYHKVPHLGTPQQHRYHFTTTTTTTARISGPLLRLDLSAFALSVNAAVKAALQSSYMVSQGTFQSNAASVSELDDSSIYTPTTTAENVTLDLMEDHTSPSWVPSHGSTVIIRSISCGNVLTLLDGNIVLAPPSGRGSILWTCIETEGWFGFRNCVSGKFICHGGDARLKCTAEERDGWRQFTITPVPKGGYVMQMLDWWTLRPIVINAQNGLQKLGRTGNKLSEGIVWSFIECRAGNADL